MPGGAQALNNPATKKAFSSAVKSFAKGGAEEISQEAIEEGFTHIASEMNKGKTFNEAATSFAEQFPQSALTSALLGGGVQTMADKKNGSAQQQPATNQQTPPPGHVAPPPQPNGKQSFSTVDAEGREIPPSDTPEPATIAPAVVPHPAAAGESASGPQIPQSATPSGPAPGKEAPTATPDSHTPPKPGSTPSAQTRIPENTTQSPADAPPGMQPSKEAASAGQVMTLDNAPQVLGDIERLKSKEKNGGLSKDEQISLHHAETLLARAQVTNLETKQKALSKLPTPRDLHSTELDALAKAKAMLARPWPGTAPASTTQSSSGSLPPGDTSTTHGVTPPAAIATSGHIGPGDTGTARTTTTSTASSGGTIPPSTGSGSGTHTTNGVTAPPVGHGNLIPEDTTHAEHIDLANRRTENLEKIARKRPLNPHEQEVYDNARHVRDRNSPAQPGDRNSPATPGSRTTSDPKDLVMAGDDGPAPPPQSAAADAPTPTAAVEPTNAVGSTINESGATNQDTPTASIAVPTPPPPAGASPSTSVAPAGSATSPPLGGPPGAVTGTSTSISASPPSGSSPPPSTISGNPASTSESPATLPAKSPLPQFAPLTPIPFPENSPEARIERQKRAPARKIILDHDGINPADKAKVLGIEKGKRPDPKTYMSDAFIKAHREEFIDGASRIISTQQLNDWGPAHTDGTSFVIPAKEFAKMLKEAGGDRGKLEAILGLPSGQLGLGSLSRVDIKDPASLNVRIPSGNEAGANKQWLPGAKLPTGKLEGVIDLGKAPPESWTHEELKF